MGMIALLTEFIRFAKEISPWFRDFRLLRSSPYYYLDVTKHLTIYPDGHGILIMSNLIRINNRLECKRLYKKVDVTDGARDMHFDTLANMHAVGRDARFDCLGFWYESENSIVRSVKEHYWSEEGYELEDRQAKENPKIFKWYFELDHTRIKDGGTYKIDCALSIPGMFPLRDGMLCEKKKPYDDYSFQSSSSLDMYTRNMRFILSFDKDIQLASDPTCTYSAGRAASPRELAPNMEYNCFYNKYIANHKKIEHHNSIVYQWDVHEIRRNAP